MKRPDVDMSTSRPQPWLDSHPSLAHSMEDFEARDFSPTIPEIPSQHSGFRSPGSSTSHSHDLQNASEYSDAAESSSARRSYSPPAWRQAGSGWFKHQQTPSPSRRRISSRDRETTPLSQSGDEGDDGDLKAYRAARRIPLPESPTKGRSPTGSPEPPSTVQTTPSSVQTTPPVKREKQDARRSDQDEEGEPSESEMTRTPTQKNYIRFSTSLDVVQRTEPIEAAVMGMRKVIRHLTASKYRTILYVGSTLFLYWICANLLRTPVTDQSPDLIQIAGLAKSFEPVIYYSENGHAQIGQLQETGVAVWDLGESVRTTNMTSAPMIVNQLDELSESLKMLGTELTSFFTGVDSDIDSILNVMEWAQRELTLIVREPPSTLSVAWSNAHTMLSHAGLIGDGRILRDILGQTYQQRTRETLERTFHQFLTTLEESINNELTWSTQLFQIFEAVDKQFLNLQRTVIREEGQQEQLANEFLSSLWTRVIGMNSGHLRKFERNQQLLSSVRNRTVQDKAVLWTHTQRLQHLKSALEHLRRRLVSPLLRSPNASTTVPIDDQIRGLQETYELLRAGRDSQKRKLYGLNYGAGSRRNALPAGASASAPNAPVHIEIGDNSPRS